MKELLITLFLIITIGALGQSTPGNTIPDAISIPSGTEIGNTTTNIGVSIGRNFYTPEGELHVFSNWEDGTVLKLETDDFQISDITGIEYNSEPDYFILGERNSSLYGNTTEFSIDIDGKIQSGFSNSSVNEQLAVLNNMAIYRSTTEKIRFELAYNSNPRMTWKSPGKNFQFFNTTNSTTALELGENGEVGVNTGDFTANHKLHVKGRTLTDEIWVQAGPNWGTSDNYFRMSFYSGPKIRWKGDASKHFLFQSETTGEVPLRMTSEGKVGINTGNFVDDHELYVGGSVYIEDDAEEVHNLWVEGSMIAEEIFVKLSGDWPDYVFSKNYDLMPLDDLESFIDENGHLPNLPSATEIEKTGELPIGETERVLTEKVEELTLYIIELKKEIDALKADTKE